MFQKGDTMSNNLPVIKKSNIFQRIFSKIQDWVNHQSYEQDGGERNTTEGIFNNVNVTKEKFQEELKVKDEDLNIEKGTLDYAIDQFLSSYYLSYQENGYINAYNALTNLGAMKIENSKGNDLREKCLLEVLKNTKRFSLREQEVSGKVYFYHVATQNYKMNPDAETIRIYLNCKRKNVVNLTSELLDEMENDNLYLKFSSDYQLSTTRRSEAIVIYTDGLNAQNCIEKIQQIYQKNPNLFEGSRNINPFMQNIDGYICYAPEPQSSIYKTSRGKELEIPKSYNSFLSKALEESFIEASRKIIAKDENLTKKTEGIISDAPDFYIRYFEDIKRTNYRDFLNTMKYELRNAQLRNRSLSIKGINRKINTRGGKINE